MLRLFTGLSLPILLRQRLTQLESAIPGARWITRENYHIALTFIGDVDEATAEDMDEAFESLRGKRFKLRLKGAGCFAHLYLPPPTARNIPATSSFRRRWSPSTRR